MFDLRALLARYPQQAWVTGTAAMVIAFAAGVFTWQKLATVRSLTFVELDEFRSDEAKRVPSKAQPLHPMEAFAGALPASLGAEQLVHRVAGAARHQGVMLISSRVDTSRSTAAGELPRGGVSLTLRGEYPGVKAVLADALARTKHATLQSLSLRRQASSGDVEAQAVLTLWLRPAVTTATPVVN